MMGPRSVVSIAVLRSVLTGLAVLVGKFSRDKGSRFERSIVLMLRVLDPYCRRVPLSGGAGGEFSGDIILHLGDSRLKVEAKKRAKGFKQIYEWIEGNDALVIGADRREPLLVVRLKDWIREREKCAALDAAATTTVEPTKR